jgi:hypothetical protein
MNQDTHPHSAESLSRLSPKDLFQLGAPDIVCARPICAGDRCVFALHTAMGARVSVLESRDAVKAAARLHDLTLVSLH